jgi:uncharacterized delta-60 repeat protein
LEIPGKTFDAKNREPLYAAQSAIRTSTVLLWFAIVVAMAGATSGPGATDLSFNAGSGVDRVVYAVALQPDGKLLVGGFFSTVKGLVRSGIARLNLNGDGDASFDPGAGAGTDALGIVYTIAVQPADGKILVGGSFTAFNGNTARKYLVRLNPDGSIDATFTPPLVKGTIYSIAVQGDGKVLVGGGNPLIADRNGIARLNANGTLDASFYPGTGISGNDSPPARVSAIAVQPSDGTVIIAGYFTSVNGTNCNGLVRLTPAGGLDPNFFGPTGSGSRVSAVLLDAAGRIIVAGGLYVPLFRSTVARLNGDGSLDGSYANPTLNGSAAAALLQPADQKVIVGGYFDQVNGVNRRQIARINTDGSLDSTFNLLPGSQAAVGINALAGQADGKVIVGNDSIVLEARSLVERLTTSGAIDPSFRADNGINGGVRSIALQSDGRIIAGGTFTTANNLDRKRVVRLNRNGSVDTSFDTSQGPGNGVLGIGPGNYVAALAVQANGNVLVGGVFSEADGANLRYFVRLNATGSVDSGFLANVNGLVNAIAVQPWDGKVVVGGGFSSVNNTPINGIARLNSNGSVDASFNPGGGTCCVTSIAVQATGQIVIGGYFHAVNGIVSHSVARLNANGGLDPGFVSALAEASSVSSFAVQPDGKVLIGGGGPAFVVRLDTDGSFDPTFAVMNDANTAVSSLVRQPDGRVLIGGGAWQPGEVSHAFVRRLLADGTADPTFNTTTDAAKGIPSSIDSMLLQPDGNLIVAGEFMTMNGVARWRVARLNAFTPPCGSEPLVVAVTPIRASHVTELRSCIDAARSHYGLAPFTYTNATIIAGVTVVKAVDVTEMQTALGQVYAAAGLAPPFYTDPGLGPGAIIRAAHILELRSALSPFQ